MSQRIDCNNITHATHFIHKDETFSIIDTFDTENLQISIVIARGSNDEIKFFLLDDIEEFFYYD